MNDLEIALALAWKELAAEREGRCRAVGGLKEEVVRLEHELAEACPKEDTERLRAEVLRLNQELAEACSKVDSTEVSRMDLAEALLDVFPASERGHCRLV